MPAFDITVQGQTSHLQRLRLHLKWFLNCIDSDARESAVPREPENLQSLENQSSIATKSESCCSGRKVQV